MHSSVLLSALANAFLLPPLNFMLMCAVGFFLRPRMRRTGNLLIALGCVLLVVLSTRAGALLLVRPLESQYPPLTTAKDAQAIVILGARRNANAPEYGHADAASQIGLKRLEYGAYLHKKTGLPLLVSGGRPDGSPETEAALMARVLHDAFGVETRWQEGASNNTRDNAEMSAALLRRDGIERVLLITDAIHMPRAMQIFSATRLQVTAAPTLYLSTARALPTDYFPQASNLSLSSYALHEWIGQLWYGVRYPAASTRSDSQ